jgi:hypothetical protein
MQGEESNQEQVRTRPPLVCFHQYGEDEDAEDIFTKIKEFKKEKRLKFTHFKQKRIIYFIVPTDNVKDFASVIRFTKSTSNFKLTYKCGTNENEAINLAKQKDSFIRLKHERGTDSDGNETNDVIMTSKLPKNLHIMASRRIFEAAGVTFDINKSISDGKKFRYVDENDETKEAGATATINEANSDDDEEQKVSENKTVSKVEAVNSDDEEEVKPEPKKRGRKPAAPKISRKI